MRTTQIEGAKVGFQPLEITSDDGASVQGFVLQLVDLEAREVFLVPIPPDVAEQLRDQLAPSGIHLATAREAAALKNGAEPTLATK